MFPNTMFNIAFHKIMKLNIVFAMLYDVEPPNACLTTHPISFWRYLFNGQGHRSSVRSLIKASDHHWGEVDGQ